jgi:hypothetical protein
VVPTTHCFSEETPIETPTGPVAIAELEVGDWVQSYDHESGRVEPRRVLRKMENPAPALLELALANGQTLHVTAEHPLFDAASGEYRPVGELGPEVRLLRLDGKGSALAPVELLAVGVAAGVEGRRAYDLTVEGNHNYFAAGVLAHNKPPPYPSGVTDPSPAPTCDRGPIEVATCFAQGEWDPTQMPLVAAAPVRAAATPFGETSSALMASLGARFPGADAGVPICEGAAVPSPAPLDAGTSPFDGGSSTFEAGTSSLGAAQPMPGDGGAVFEAGVALAATLTPPAVLPMPTDPRLDGGRGSDAGPRREAGEYDAASPFPRDAGTVAAPIGPSCTHALWLEFGRCLYVSAVTPYAASVTLRGAPGQYRLSLLAGTGVVACGGAEPIAEWTLRVDDSPVVEWLTLPESGAPYEIVARGDGPFAIEITLF